MRRIQLAWALLGLSLLTACGGNLRNGQGNTDPGAPPATNSFSGTVTLKGTPLAGATVTAFLTNTNSVFQTATTDAQGNYSFSGLQAYGNVAADYQFWVNKDGYGFYPSVGSGAKVTRFDYTGQFQGNGLTDIEIDFTVIDFISRPNSSLSGADFTAYDGSNPLVALASTGQATTGTPGDDGSAAKGVPWPSARFTDNQDGTVTDHLTGLLWLKDATCLSPNTWSQALAAANQLASGSCGLTDGSSAGQWRLPNLNELESVVDVSASNPAITPGSPFTVSNGIYWSSTSYFGGQGGSSKAWAIRLADGRYMNDTSSNVKATANNAVWAVRGGGSAGLVKLQATGFYVPYAAGDDGSLRTGVPMAYPRFVDKGDGTMLDVVTGLRWLKRADCIHQNWGDAIAEVSALANGQCGLTDGSTAGMWRMPNRTELLSLSDRMKSNQADFFNHSYSWKSNGALYQPPIFNNFMVSEYYWTSTTDAADPSKAWTIYSCDYGVYDAPKSASGYTLAVR